MINYLFLVTIFSKKIKTSVTFFTGAFIYFVLFSMIYYENKIWLIISITRETLPKQCVYFELFFLKIKYKIFIKIDVLVTKIWRLFFKRSMTTCYVLLKFIYGK